MNRQLLEQLALEEQAEASQGSGALAKKVLLGVGLGSGLLLLACGIIVALVLRRYEAGLPSVEQLKSGYHPPQVTRVLARDGTLLASVFTERRTVVPFERIPQHTKLAFLAAEDAHFYEHEGLNYFGMLRALVANLRAGRTVQGGSTITQQVVKNVLLDARRTYERKIRETLLARRVEQQLKKDEIFALYLNHIYLGHGRYGIEEAAQYYFGKPCSALDLPESALLSGLVAAPERFSPRHNMKRALERRRYVLDQMYKKGFLASAELRDRAATASVRLAPAVEAESELAPEIVGRVRKLLAELVGEGANNGGFTIHTTLDPRLQAEARRAVRDNLDRYLARQKLAPPFTLEERRLWGKLFEGKPRQYGIHNGRVVEIDDKAGTIEVMVGDKRGLIELKKEDRYNPKRLPPSEFVSVGAELRVSVQASAEGSEALLPLRLELGPQSALVALDVRTREVLALVGSYEAVIGGLDRTLSLRQPGSAFKPFVYSYALHKQAITPATSFEVKGKDPEGEPQFLRLREGIATSNNQVASHVYNLAGGPGIVDWAKRCGIESKLAPTPSLALGAYEVSPVEMAQAFSTFAGAGVYKPVSFVTKVVGPLGKELALAPVSSRRAMSEQVAFLITSLLNSVTTEGTARRAKVLNRPVAGKTGTTNQAKDAWFVGYSTDIVTAVWVGYDDALPLGWGESGARTALPAWIDFMRKAHEGRPVTEFVKPPGIVSVSIDPATGLLAYHGQEDAVVEHFLDGTIPNQVALPPEQQQAEAGPSELTRIER